MCVSTRVVVDRTLTAAWSPPFSTTWERLAVGTTAGEGAVPDAEDPILRRLADLLRAVPGPQLPHASPRAASAAGEPAPAAGCGQQVSQPLSVETATAAAVTAIKQSCDGPRQAAVDFIEVHLGQVLATQGWARALRTQPQEMVRLSVLLSERLAATSAATTTESTATPTTQQDSEDSEDSDDSEDSKDSGHGQTVTATEPPMPTCPTTPLDDDAVSLLRSLSEEEKKSKLMEATKQGEVEEVRTLLAAGASTEARDEHGSTALHWAAWNRFAKVARCLLDAGADVSSTDDGKYQPLHYAASGGDPAMVRMLAAWGANPNARDIYGWTPLHLTVRDSHPEAALALLQVGANREVRNKNGRTPLDKARKLDSQLLIDVLAKS